MKGHEDAAKAEKKRLRAIYRDKVEEYENYQHEMRVKQSQKE